MENAKTVFSDFLGLSLPTIIILAVFIVAGIVFVVLSKKGIIKLSGFKFDTRMLVYGAMCIAIAFLLSYIRFYRMPQGGSITPASMLPIMMYAYAFGPLPGVICGFAYGILQIIQDPYFVHPVQVILDYFLSFGALSFAGCFKKNILPGIVAACFGRFIFQFLSGMVFFGMFAPEGQSPFVYSLIYNASVVFPDGAICFIVACIPQFRAMLNRMRPAVTHI